MTVEDGCELSRDAHSWVVSHGDRWHISCTRTATAVCGASGPAGPQIRELAAAAGAAGWACHGDRIPDPVGRLAELLLDQFQLHGAGHATAGWRPAKVPSRRPAGARPAACRQTAAVPHHSCRTHAASVAGASAVSPAPAPRHPASRLPGRHTVLPAGRAERRGHHDPREADIRHSRPRIRRVNTDYLSRAKPLAATPEPATAT